MPTPGELLARQLLGDTTVCNSDIEHATNIFFSDQGFDVHCVVGQPKDEKEISTVSEIVKKRQSQE